MAKPIPATLTIDGDVAIADIGEYHLHTRDEPIVLNGKSLPMSAYRDPPRLKWLLATIWILVAERDVTATLPVASTQILITIPQKDQEGFIARIRQILFVLMAYPEYPIEEVAEK